MNNFIILSKAVNYIENNLNKDFTRSDIAKHCYVSLSYLEKIFKWCFERSIKDYILKRRMTEAAKDMIHNNMSVTDVAMKYQYNSLESFSRAFKSVWQVNPKNFKASQKFTDLLLKIDVNSNDEIPKYKKVDISNLYNILSTLKDTYILCFDGVNFCRYNEVSFKCGDKAIIEIARRIDKYAKDDMFTIRIGGDEFALVTKLYDYNDALIISNTIKQENGNEFEYEGKLYPLSLWCSIIKLDDNIGYNELFINMQDTMEASKNRG